MSSSTAIQQYANGSMSRKKITLKVLEPPSVRKNGIKHSFFGTFEDENGGIYILDDVVCYEQGWFHSSHGYTTTDLSKIPINEKGELHVEEITKKYGLLYTKIGEVPAIVLKFVVNGS